ncbi:MAG: hypothetical protein Q7T86_06960 [Hyphomicrobiaceae bacterium]|nr:hypothetical protein [Hyphomicrobiaceae bacterium]
MTIDSDQASSTLTFAQVVERLETARSPAAPTEYGPGSAISSGSAAQPTHEPAYVSPNALSQIYESTAVSFGPTRPAAQKTDPAPSTRPQDIARELKLRIWHSAGQLLEIRRRFAMNNHPDRVAATMRDAATTRMSIANGLIDEALRAREPRQ